MFNTVNTGKCFRKETRHNGYLSLLDNQRKHNTEHPSFLGQNQKDGELLGYRA